MILSKEQKGKRWKIKKQSLRALWETIKHTNVSTTQVPEGGGRETGVGVDCRYIEMILK